MLFFVRFKKISSLSGMHRSDTRIDVWRYPSRGLSHRAKRVRPEPDRGKGRSPSTEDRASEQMKRRKQMETGRCVLYSAGEAVTLKVCSQRRGRFLKLLSIDKKINRLCFLYIWGEFTLVSICFFCFSI